MAKKLRKNNKIKKEIDITIIRCKRCNRIIHGEKSKILGYGSICFKKHLNEPKYMTLEDFGI